MLVLFNLRTFDTQDGHTWRPWDPLIALPDGWKYGTDEMTGGTVMRFPDDWFTPDGWERLNRGQGDYPILVERYTSDAIPKLVQSHENPKLRERRLYLDVSRLTSTRRAALEQTKIKKEVIDAVAEGFVKTDWIDKEALDPKIGTEVLSG